jgi:hypothetical protein
MAELTDTDIRDQVRDRYAAAAKAVQETTSSGCCGSAAGEAGCGPAAAFTDPDMRSTDKDGTEVFGRALYAGAEAATRAPRMLAARPERRYAARWRTRSH